MFVTGGLYLLVLFINGFGFVGLNRKVYIVVTLSNTYYGGNQMIQKKTFLLEVEPEVWEQFKQKIPREISLQAKLNELIKKFIEE